MCVQHRSAFVLWGVVIVVAVLGAQPALYAQSPRKMQHEGIGAHVPCKTTAIYDPRLTPYHVRYAPVGDRIIVQGDIDLGSVENARRRFIAHIIEVSALALKDANLVSVLTSQQRQRLQRAAAMKPERIGAAQTSLQDAEDASVEIQRLRKGSDALLGEFRRQSATKREGDHRQYRWPGGVIPYLIDPSCPNQELIAKAIRHWHAKTNHIRFVLRTDTNAAQFANWVRFKAGALCSSEVGKLPGPGEQAITLDAGCETPQIIHEIGHAVGLFHEHCRSDRAQYVTLQPDNVNPDLMYNFDMITDDDGGNVGRFDFGSIMLYPARAFSRNGLPTLVRSASPADMNWGIETGGLGGTTTELSSGDVEGVHRMYPLPTAP